MNTQGNAVTYEYDEMSRVTKVTPTQGTNYRTEYSYNKNGSLSQVKTYDSGTGSDTDYSYNTTSGKLSYRDFPTISSQNIRTTYSYDSAGRLQYETVTRETGSTTNLYRTSYAYSYSSYHRQVVRTPGKGRGKRDEGRAEKATVRARWCYAGTERARCAFRRRGAMLRADRPTAERAREAAAHQVRRLGAAGLRGSRRAARPCSGRIPWPPGMRPPRCYTSPT